MMFWVGNFSQQNSFQGLLLNRHRVGVAEELLGRMNHDPTLIKRWRDVVPKQKASEWCSKWIKTEKRSHSFRRKFNKYCSTGTVSSRHVTTRLFLFSRLKKTKHHVFYSNGHINFRQLLHIPHTFNFRDRCGPPSDILAHQNLYHSITWTLFTQLITRWLISTFKWPIHQNLEVFHHAICWTHVSHRTR